MQGGCGGHGLGWVDFDLGSLPGWWACYHGYLPPYRSVELPKYKSTQPCFTTTLYRCKIVLKCETMSEILVQLIAYCDRESNRTHQLAVWVYKGNSSKSDAPKPIDLKTMQVPVPGPGSRLKGRYLCDIRNIFGFLDTPCHSYTHATYQYSDRQKGGPQVW